MSVLQESFFDARKNRRAGFIPFVVAGDPDLATTAELLPALSKLNPTAIEVGVAFSDPIADGVVIQAAAERALHGGVTLRAILKMLRTARSRRLAPLVLFSYYNPIFQFGLKQFADAAAASGVAGVLVVDLPAKAARPLREQLRRHGIDLIFLVAPTTSEARLAEIVQLASGFIYAVARTGVTGRARQLADESEQLVGRIRAVTGLPIAVGFGISNARQAQRIGCYADAVVVGSRLVAEIAEAKSLSRAALVRRVTRCAGQFT